MTFDAHKNFAGSIVTAAPSPAMAGTTLSVSSTEGAKFPAPPFDATVFPLGMLPELALASAEIVRVTAIGGDTFTIARAQGGSNPRPIIEGDRIVASVTAKALTDIEAIVTGLANTTGTGSPPAPTWLVMEWALAQSFTLVSATRDTNGAITTASVTWPDGATGTFTTDTASATFPGAIDAYHVTYVYGSGPTTKTITQAAVTRDPSTGAVTAQPAITVA